MKSILLFCFSLLVVAQARFVQRIYGGKDAPERTFPNVATLKGYRVDPNMIVHFCGGTIINELWILVTAKCVSDIEVFSKEHVRVEVGRLRIAGWEPFLQTREVSGAYAHDKYQLHPTIYPFDLGVVKLHLTLIINQYVKPLPFSSNKAYPEGYVILLGWGRSDMHETAAKIPSEYLQFLNTTIISREQCIDISKKSAESRNLAFQNAFNEYMFCTGSATSMEGASGGDAGGPVMQKNATSGQYNVVGVMSVRLGPAGTAGPTVHTHVPPLMPWVEYMMSRM